MYDVLFWVFIEWLNEEEEETIQYSFYFSRVHQTPFFLIQEHSGIEPDWMLTHLTKSSLTQTRATLNVRNELKNFQTSQ